MYNVLIMGAGQIAAGFDTPDSPQILTHAHAISVHGGFNLLGFYDTALEKAQRAAVVWGAAPYDTLRNVSADIVVIATPDEFHLSGLRQALELKPKLVILEKPIAKTAADAGEIVELSKQIPIAVNFSRRFSREIQKLAAELESFGAFQTGTGYYGKGFVHNGSHMLDLLLLLVGEVDNAKVLSETADFYPDDPSKTVYLTFKIGGEFFMQAVDCRNYTVFDVNLFFEHALVRISNAQIEIFKEKESGQWAGYKFLEPAQTRKTDLGRAMYNLYDNVYGFLERGEALLSTPQTGARWLK